MTRQPAAEQALQQKIWTTMRSLVIDRYDRRGEVADALQLSFIRAKALRRLSAAGPLTMRELAVQIATDAPYTTVVVDDLENRGLVERSPHPEDRRAKIVTVTAEGAAAAARAERILNQPPPVLQQLPAADLATLDRILTALLQDGEGS
jgi:DNA-binding MarR family transcriptional regulator